MAYSRPRTTGGLNGPGGHSNVDKRMSRDDSFVSSRRPVMASSNNRMSRDDSYIRDRMAAMSQFHIPATGSAAALTPAHSPHHAEQEAWVPVRRMDTPESMVSGDIPIGMALGSPVHTPPEASRWQAQIRPPSSQTTIVSSISSAAMSGSNGSLQRKKTGRRRLFGLFGGGKKHTGEDERLRNLSNGSGASTSTLTQTESSTPKIPTRSNTQVGGRPPTQKGLLRSNTMPESTTEDPNATFPVAMSRDPFMRPPNENSGENSGQTMPVVPPIPRLDVLIPDIKLERYSVMFSDVLKMGSGSPQQQQQQEAPASLLSRRQATLERLKTINGNNGGHSLEPVEEEDKTRQRSSTSPQASSHSRLTQPSPRLSVFPVPPARRAGPAVSAPAIQTRISRSNTSPGRLPSPTHSTFEKRHKVTTSKGTLNLEVPSPPEVRPISSKSSLSRPQEPILPTDTSFYFGPDQSNLVLDSPTVADSEEDIATVSPPSRPAPQEPQWQLVPPVATLAPSSSITSLHGRSSSVTSSASTPKNKPSFEFNRHDDAALANAVEVSIQRQISMSRQQKNLLRPLNTTARRPSTGESRGAVAKSPTPSRLGKDEPIRDIKIATPTLVQHRGSPVDPQNRKSSLVILGID